MNKPTKIERAEALEALRRLVKPGATIYTILRHVSRSGMQRQISLYVQTEDGMRWLDGYACTALGWRRASGFKDAVVVNGCGMDMGFHLVYELSHALFRDGFGCIGEGCPNNDHSNGDRDYTPHGQFTPSQKVKMPSGLYDPASYDFVHWHKDGGYALRQEWL